MILSVIGSFQRISRPPNIIWEPPLINYLTSYNWFNFRWTYRRVHCRPCSGQTKRSEKSQSGGHNRRSVQLWGRVIKWSQQPIHGEMFFPTVECRRKLDCRESSARNDGVGKRRLGGKCVVYVRRIVDVVPVGDCDVPPFVVVFDCLWASMGKFLR